MSDTEEHVNGVVLNEQRSETHYVNDLCPEVEQDPVIQQDMCPDKVELDPKDIERRKKVEMIINSQMFREELERIFESQNEGYNPASLSALQQVRDLLLPSRGSSAYQVSRNIIPINDIRGVDCLKYGKGEKLLRCKLASVFRLLDMHGWTENVYNHITLRVSPDQEHFLLNPFGLQYNEVTAASLLKVDMQGNVVDSGTTNFSFNWANFILHSVIHAARPDVNCVVHIKHPACVAVSASKYGLLPTCQEAVIVGEISYHEYQGIIVDREERDLITKNLGPVNKILVLQHNGIVVCGETIEETFSMLRHVITACETQVHLMPIGLDNIQLMSKEEQQQVRDMVRGQQETEKIPLSPGAEEKEKTEGNEKLVKSKVWDLEFEAQMRLLENAGLRTGYVFRQSLKSEDPRLRSDVEAPPAASLSGYVDEDKWLSPLKKLLEGKKTQDKLRWVNSPNIQQKVEVTETTITSSKKTSKFDLESSPPHSTPIKTTSPPQFHSPDAQTENTTVEQVVMNDVEGAQSNATTVVYNLTEEEMDQYKRIMEKKQKGEKVSEVPEKLKPIILALESGQVSSVTEVVTTPDSRSSAYSASSPISDDDVFQYPSGAQLQRSLSDKVKVSVSKKAHKMYPRQHAYSVDQTNYGWDGSTTTGEKVKSTESGEVSDSSQSSKEESKDSKKDKKKKKGLRTPSFLKKRKAKKEGKEKSTS
ncbi:protein hu-li tai shao-like isoform X2 [Tachypleus tridentatus]|uniref:protein hu-li tai shao-like isoform X2 n=1 Tax=Tachypleus tridentatus TaxID=6853 RepID=UPI003FD47CBA